MDDEEESSSGGGGGGGGGCYGSQNEPSQYGQQRRRQSLTSAEIIANQSQNYIDEKLAEYHETIQCLQFEQERVQKKTFVNWINSHLAKRNPPLFIEDLIRDLRDGTMLLALLEVLSGESLVYEKSRKLRRPHFLSNINTALKFLARKRIKLVNINAGDLVDGKPSVVLGLVWTIILYFQIEENSQIFDRFGGAYSSSITSLDSVSSIAREKWSRGARKSLLNWVNNIIPSNSKIEIRNFGTCWRDGYAFLHMIDAIRADLVNFASLDEASNYVRLETAFDLAETELEIIRLLDPEDVDVEKPDEKSVMTYVAQFLHKYPETKIDSDRNDAADELETWLRHQIERLQRMRTDTKSYSLNFDDYSHVRNEAESRVTHFNRQSANFRTKKIVAGLKTELDYLLNEWLWFLDERISEMEFRAIAVWIQNGERLLLRNAAGESGGSTAKSAVFFSSKLEEHKQYFADYDRNRSEFYELFNRMRSHSSHLSDLRTRLTQLETKAARKKTFLKFHEHKYCLIAFLQLIETKIELWHGKCGDYESVCSRLDEYANFVTANDIFGEFERAFADMQTIAAEYVRCENFDKYEQLEIDNFLHEVTEKWQKFSLELFCLKTVLTDSQTNWNVYVRLYDEFREWFSEAEQHLQNESIASLRFFDHIQTWCDKFTSLNESVEFLMQTSNESGCARIEHEFRQLSAAWHNLLERVRVLQNSNEAILAREKFDALSRHVNDWFETIERELAASDDGSDFDRIDRFETYQNELIAIDEKLKTLATLLKLFQDTHRKQALDRGKNRFTKIGGELSQKIHYLHDVRCKRDSIENAGNEIRSWIVKSNDLLARPNENTSLGNCSQKIIDLQKVLHESQFLRALFDNKFNLMQSICATSGSSDLANRMTRLSDDFSQTVHDIEQTIERLRKFGDIAKNYDELKNVLDQSIYEKQKFLLNNENCSMGENFANDNYLNEFKRSFDELCNRHVNEFVNLANQLRDSLTSSSDRERIDSDVDTIFSQIHELQSSIPKFLEGQRFAKHERNFRQKLNELDGELCKYEHAFANRTSSFAKLTELLNDSLKLHEHQSNFEYVRDLLETLNCLQAANSQFANRYQNCATKWQALLVRKNRLAQQLNEIPRKVSEYERKFADFDNWLTSIEEFANNLRQNEFRELQDFEVQQKIFEDFCEEIETKKDDFKWLTKSYNELSKNFERCESSKYAGNYAKLVDRFQCLLPTLQTLRQKTETIQTYFSYEKEVHEMCEIVKCYRTIEPVKITLADLESLIERQTRILNELDSYCEKIEAVLAKGRRIQDLLPLMENLEQCWTATRSTCTESLRKLHETKTLTESFRRLRNEIGEIVRETGTRLAKMRTANEIDFVEQKLFNEKVKICEKTLLVNWKRIAHELNEVLVEDDGSRGVFEVSQLEDQLKRHCNEICECTEHLERVQSVRNAVDAKLEIFADWLCANSLQSFDRVLNDRELNAEQQFERIERAKIETCAKIDELERLSTEIDGGASDDGNDDLKRKFRKIANDLKDLSEFLNSQCLPRAARKLLEFKKYRKELQEIEEWHATKLDQKYFQNFERNLDLELLPKSLDDLGQFRNDCSEKIAVLNHWIGESNENDRVCDLIEKIETFDRQLQRNVQNLEKARIEWTGFREKLLAMENFNRETVAALNTANSSDDNYVQNLKVLYQDLMDKQMHFMQLSQNVLDFCNETHSTNRLEVKNRLDAIKNELGANCERVSVEINETSEKILHESEFRENLRNFESWILSSFRVLEENMELDAGADDNDDDDDDEAAGPADTDYRIGLLNRKIDIVNDLFEEFQRKRLTFNELYNEIKEASFTSNKQKENFLNELYSKIAMDYQSFEKALDTQQQFLKNRKDFNYDFCNLVNQYEHVKFLIESCASTRNANELISFRNQLNAIRGEKIADLRSRYGLVSSDRKRVKRVENEIDQHLETIERRLVDISTTNERLERMHAAKSELDRAIDAYASKLNELRTKTVPVGSADTIGGWVAAVRETFAESRVAIEAKLADYARFESDTNLIDLVSDNRLLDLNSSRANDTFLRISDEFSQYLTGLNEIEQLVRIVANQEVDLKRFVREIQVVHDDSLQSNKEKIAKIKANKSRLDSYLQNCQLLSSKSNCNRSETSATDLKRDWFDLYENLVKNQQVLENAKIVTDNLKTIDEKLTSWFREIHENEQKIYKSKFDYLLAQEFARKYDQELPAHRSLMKNFALKFKQLTDLTGQENPFAANGDRYRSEFARLEQFRDQLNENFEEIDRFRLQLKHCLKMFDNLLGENRKKLVKCDDYSGDLNAIRSRLGQCKSILGNLKAIEQNDLRKINELFSQSNCENFLTTQDESTSVSCTKRFESLREFAIRTAANLEAFLVKFRNDQFEQLNRKLDNLREKVNWCAPEAIRDPYSFEMKRKYLRELEPEFLDCEEKMAKLDANESLAEKFTKFKLLFAEISAKIDESLSLWTDLETKIKQFDTSLNEYETKLKTIDAAIQSMSSFDEIAPKTDEIRDFETSVTSDRFAGSTIERLFELNAILLRNFPQIQNGSVLKMLDSLKIRQRNLIGACKCSKDRLETLRSNYVQYCERKSQIEQLLSQLQSSLKCGTAGSGRDVFEQFKHDAKERIRSSFNSFAESGEKLCIGLKSENRDRIRSEINECRKRIDDFNRTIDRISKELEKNQLAKNSLDENLTQLAQFVETKLNEIAHRFRAPLHDLNEKIECLNFIETIDQELQIRDTLIEQLAEYGKQFDVSDFETKFAQVKSNLERLRKTIDEKSVLVRDCIDKHRKYVECENRLQQTIENFQREIEPKFDAANETRNAIDAIGELIVDVDDVIARYEVAFATESTICSEILQRNRSIDNNFDSLRTKAENCLGSAKERIGRVREQFEASKQADRLMDSLHDWLTKFESLHRDQTLKNSEQSKRNHWKKLADSRDDIDRRQSDFERLRTDCGATNESDDLMKKKFDLIGRFESLKETFDELTKKYEKFTKNHEHFNRDLRQLTESLNEHEAKCEFGTDESYLHDREKIEELKTIRAALDRDEDLLNELFVMGENLYVQTSSDGRETIRQQLKQSKSKLEAIRAELHEKLTKIEEFDEKFNRMAISKENLNNFLHNMRKLFGENCKKNLNIEDQKIQLKNLLFVQKELDKESYQFRTFGQLVESSSAAIGELHETQTQLTDSLAGLKRAVAESIDYSRVTIDRLTSFDQLQNDLIGWFRKQQTQLNESNQISIVDDRAKMADRYSQLKRLQENRAKTDDLVTSLKAAVNELLAPFADTSDSESGHFRTFANLEEEIADFYKTIDKLIIENENLLREIQEADELAQNIAKKFDDFETKIRNRKLRANCAEKREVVAQLEQWLQEIGEYESIIGNFAKNPIGNQQFDRLNAKYRNLIALGGESRDLWHRYVENHEQFDRLLNEEAASEMDRCTNEFETGAADCEQLTARAAIFDTCLARLANFERDTLTELKRVEDKILPETNMSGRQTIREQTKSLSDRFNSLAKQLKLQKKLVDDRIAESNRYRANFQNCSASLNAIEQSLAAENRTGSQTMHELKEKAKRLASIEAKLKAQEKVLECLLVNFADLDTERNRDRDRDTVDLRELEALKVHVNEQLAKSIGEVVELIKTFESFQDLQKSCLQSQMRLKEKLDQFNVRIIDAKICDEKLDELDKLKSHNIEDLAKIEQLKRLRSDMAADVASDSGRRKFLDSFAHDIDHLKNYYDQNLARILQAQNDLENWRKTFADLESQSGRIARWIRAAKSQLRSFTLQSSIAQTRCDLDLYRGLDDDSDKIKFDFENFIDNFNLANGDASVRTGSGGGGGASGTLQVNIDQMPAEIKNIKIAAQELCRKCEKKLLQYEQFRRDCDDIRHSLQTYSETFESIKTNAEIDRNQLESEMRVLLDNMHTLNSKVGRATETSEKIIESASEDEALEIERNASDIKRRADELLQAIEGYESYLIEKIAELENFEKKVELMENFLRKFAKLQTSEISLQSTFADKQNQLQAYQNLRKQLQSNESILNELKTDPVILRDARDGKSADLRNRIAVLAVDYATLVDKLSEWIKLYEIFVQNHQDYVKSVKNFENWHESSTSWLQVCGEIDCDKLALASSLDKLTNLKSEYLNEGRLLLTKVGNLSGLLRNETSADGQTKIDDELIRMTNAFDSVDKSIRESIDTLDANLKKYLCFERDKNTIVDRLKAMETETLNCTALKSNLLEKIAQFESIVCVQNELACKEPEIDTLLEEYQQLMNGQNKNSHKIADLLAKYQQVANRTKTLANQWNDFVQNHRDLDEKLQEMRDWIARLDNRLVRVRKNFETQISGDFVAEIESLVAQKEIGFAKLKELIDLFQIVFVETDRNGQIEIDRSIENVRKMWSDFLSRLTETKSELEFRLSCANELHEKLANYRRGYKDLKKSCDSLLRVSVSDSFAKKKEILQQLEELLQKSTLAANEVRALDKSEIANNEIRDLINSFETNLVNLLRAKIGERESDYRNHRKFHEALDEFRLWSRRVRERAPDASTQIDNFANASIALNMYEKLLNKRTQGELMIDNLNQLQAAIVDRGAESVRAKDAEIDDFQTLFDRLESDRVALLGTIDKWTRFVARHETVSDSIQQIAILVKNEKCQMFSSNVGEKSHQIDGLKAILERLLAKIDEVEDLSREFAGEFESTCLRKLFASEIEKLRKRAETEKSGAESLIETLETNLRNHLSYDEAVRKITDWLRQMKEAALVRDGSDAGLVDREALERQLVTVKQVQNDFEQNHWLLLQGAKNAAEHVLKTVKSDAKSQINSDLKAIESECEKLQKKLTNLKVELESNLLKLVDFNCSYSQLEQLIDDRYRKLREIEQKDDGKTVRTSPEPSVSIAELLRIDLKKTIVRNLKSLLDDIQTLKPMMESIEKKSQSLTNRNATGNLPDKFDRLVNESKSRLERRKSTVDLYESFVECENEFRVWLAESDEKFRSCIDTIFDRNALTLKFSQLQCLVGDMERGETKLDRLMDLWEKVYQANENHDRTVIDDSHETIENELTRLQNEFDRYKQSLKTARVLLQQRILQWNEYETSYACADQWLNDAELSIRKYDCLKPDIEAKRQFLEQMQTHLQSFFDWQKTVDTLDSNARKIFEFCPNSGIGNAVTKISSRYNMLLSLSKELLRKLELHFQEHQQYNSLCLEFDGWIEASNEKLDECEKVANAANSMDEIVQKLTTIGSIEKSLNAIQNKYRYTQELKDKVLMNTQETGAKTIVYNSENAKKYFDKLLVRMHELKTKLSDLQNSYSGLRKDRKLLDDYLHECEQKIERYCNNGDDSASSSENKSNLEILKMFASELRAADEYAIKLRAKVTASDSSDFVLDGDLRREIEDSLRKYDDIRAKIAKRIEKIELEIANFDSFVHESTSLLDDLMRVDTELKSGSETIADNLDAVIDRKSNLIKLKKRFDTIENQIDLLRKFHGSDEIGTEIEKIRTFSNALKTRFDETLVTLTDSIENWTRFFADLKEIECWLNETKTLLKTIENVHEAKVVVDELQRKKTEIAGKICEKIEKLPQLNCSDSIREKSIELLVEHSKLLSDAKILENNFAHDFDSFENFNAKREKTLDRMQQLKSKLNEAESMEFRSLADLDNSLQTFDSLFASEVPEINSLFNNMEIILMNFRTNSMNGLKTDLNEMQNVWMKIDKDLHAKRTELKSVRAEFVEMSNARDDFASFLAGSSKIIDEEIRADFDSNESMKNLRNRAKNLLGELEKKFQQFEKSQKSISRAIVTDTDFDRLRFAYEIELEKLHEKIAFFEMSIEEAGKEQKLLLDFEKWLLQISFQLMSPRPLTMQNRNKIAELVRQHDYLIGDIENYRKFVEGMAAKKYDNISEMCANYENVSETAQRIRKQFDSCAEKFRKYDRVLDEIEAKANDFENELAAFDQERPAIALDELSTRRDRLQVLARRIKDEQKNLTDIRNECETEISNLAKSNYRHAAETGGSASVSVGAGSGQAAASNDNQLTKEFEIRLKLNDLSEQCDFLLEQLQSKICDLENRAKKHAELREWIGEKNELVASIAKKPMKLHAKIDCNYLLGLDECLDEVEQKLAEMARGESDESESLLANLKNDVQSAIANRKRNQKEIDDFERTLEQVHLKFDKMFQSLDEIEKSLDLTCLEKLEKLHELETECEQTIANELQTLAAAADRLRSLIDRNEWTRIDDDYLRNVERRSNEFAEKLKRKRQIIEMNRNEYELMRHELVSQPKQLNEKYAENFAAIESRAYDLRSETLKNEINSIRNFLRDLDFKQKLKGNFRKRIESSERKFRTLEFGELQKLIDAFENSLVELTKRSQQNLTKVLDAIETRTALENDMKDFETGCENFASEIDQLFEYTEPKSERVEQQIGAVTMSRETVDNFAQTKLRNLLQKIDRVFGESNESARKELGELKTKFESDVRKIFERLDDRIRVFSHDLECLRSFESKIRELRNFYADIESTLKTDVNTDYDCDSIRKQLDRYETYREQIGERIDTIESYEKNGSNKTDFRKNFKKDDCLMFNEQLAALKINFIDLKKTIDNQIETIRKLAEDYRSKNRQAVALVESLDSIRDQLSNTVRDPAATPAQSLDLFDRLANELNANRTLYGDLIASSKFGKKFRDDLMRNHQIGGETFDALAKSIENHVIKINKFELLRRQFELIGDEFDKSIDNYEKTFDSIEQSKLCVADKLRQFESLSGTVYESEAQLALLVDKANEIGEHYSSFDSQTVVRDAKTKLANVKKSFENTQLKYRSLANEHEKLSNRINELIDWFNENDSKIDAKPAMSLDENWLETAVAEQHAFDKQVAKRLETIDEIDRIDARNMPAFLRDKLSDLRSFRSSVPARLRDRLDYLNEFRDIYAGYRQIRDGVRDAVTDAEQFLNTFRKLSSATNDDDDEFAFAYDFQRIEDHLEKHCAFFKDFHTKRELYVRQMQSVIDKLWPKISKTDRDRLMNEQSELCRLIDTIVSREKFAKSSLVESIDLWTEWNSIVAKIRLILSRADEVFRLRIDRLSDLQFCARQADDILHDLQNQQNNFELLQERGEQLQTCANKYFAELLATETSGYCEQWACAKSELEKKSKVFHVIFDLWQEFAKDFETFEKLLTAFDCEIDRISVEKKSIEQLNDAKSLVKKLLGEFQMRKIGLEKLHLNAKPILEFSEVYSPKIGNEILDSLNAISDRYESLADKATERLHEIDNESLILQNFQRIVNETNEKLMRIRKDVRDYELFACGNEHEEIGREKFANFNRETERTLDETQKFIFDLKADKKTAHCNDGFLKLELLIESAQDSLAEKARKFNEICDLCGQYAVEAGAIDTLMTDFETKLDSGCDNFESKNLGGHLNELQTDFNTIAEKCAQLAQKNDEINDKLKSMNEKSNRSSSSAARFNSLRQRFFAKKQELVQISNWLLKFWQLHETITKRIREKELFLATKVPVKNVKDVNDLSQQSAIELKSFRNETTAIGELCKILEQIEQQQQFIGVTDLAIGLQAIKSAESVVLTKLNKRNMLLKEAAEEWFQYEKKNAEARNWLDATISKRSKRHNIVPDRPESVPNQIAHLTKIRTDLDVQTLKIQLARDKLAVHLSQSEWFSIADEIENHREIVDELETNRAAIMHELRTKELCLRQIFNYQIDIGKLHETIASAKLQISSLSGSGSDRDHQQYQELNDSIESAQKKIAICHAKIRELTATAATVVDNSINNDKSTQ